MFRSMGEGLDKDYSTDSGNGSIDANLETLSNDIDGTNNVMFKRKIARHTSDISHRIGKN